MVEKRPIGDSGIEVTPLVLGGNVFDWKHQATEQPHDAIAPPVEFSTRLFECRV